VNARTALVVGGTGPTGPFLVDGLLQRGFDVTIFHRGRHEPSGLPPVRHIHGDPHFRETIDDALGAAEYDVVIATYGRIRHLAEALAGRCAQFLAVGGVPVYRGFNEPDVNTPSGLSIPVAESAPLVDTLGEVQERSLQFAQLMVATEQAVLDCHPVGSCFRYPLIYGRHNPFPWEWLVIKRVLDGRRRLILPDGGLRVHQRCAAANAAHFLLCAVDRPLAAAGLRFNVADGSTWTYRQWVELICAHLGVQLELVPIPSDIAVELDAAIQPFASPVSAHSIFDNELGRSVLGFQNVVDPVEALGESVDWYVRNGLDLTDVPAIIDPFDYSREDQLIEAYRRARAVVLAQVPQVRPSAFHAMPHPKTPFEADRRNAAVPSGETASIQ
jgi:nucleoside-diphosphate-sugar epimerase